MTTETQPLPTDAELLAEWDRVSHIADAGQRRLACLRAALAKWGTPPAVAAEPWGAYIGGRAWVGKLLPDIALRMAEAEGRPIQWLYTTPQPTQPQAGAVPLTVEQLLLLRFATSSLFHLFERWNNKEIPHYQLMDEMGQVIEHVIQRTVAASGIKGGQHG